jgi:hypothetical protein
MADRLAENGAIIYAQESTATAGTIPRLAGAGQIKADIRKLVADGFYTSPVSGLSVRGRLINKALGSVISFSPTSLFTANEQGLWYDPSDYSSMFQDVAGTIPVTAVEQPVGLIIDKRNGGVLNPQLVTNGTFDTDTDWTKGTGWTIAAGVATKIAGVASLLSQSETLVAGKTYRVVYTITRSAGSITPQFRGGSTISGTARASSGTYVDFITAVSGNNSLAFDATSLFAGTVDNVYMREVTGNDGCQITSASRPTLKALYNLFTYTEQFENAYWVKIGASVSSNSITAPDGTNTADKLIEDTATTGHYLLSSAITTVVGINYTASVSVKKDTRDYIALYASEPAGGKYFNINSGTISTDIGNPVSSSITSLGDGWYRCSITFAATTTSTTIRLMLADNTPDTLYTGNGTSGAYFWGADLRVANDGVGLPTYQRIHAATDYDTVGFPPYLSCDGADDHLIGQPNLDLSAGDKVTVWTGQRKLRDSASPPIVSSVASPTGSGYFVLYAPNLSVSYRFTNVGTVAANTGSGTFAAAPSTDVLTGIGDISGDIVTLRLDGAVRSTVNTDQGTGNYRSTSQFYIGRAATAYYQGRIYSLIVRMAASTDTEITNTETYVNTKTKAY